MPSRWVLKGARLAYSEDNLAAYAVKAAESRGRLHPQRDDPDRSPFSRDRDRIIHSTAFRRLQFKTQVFVYHEGDHYRTRLTHSLEVSQIARTIARILGLNEDLAETLALAHDLGHPPFAHAGEEALQDCMDGHGGFDHNAQSLKIVTQMEHRYAGFAGLNLTWESLEGLVKHNGPVMKPFGPITTYDQKHPLELSSYASLEAQVAAMSDDIAYNNHDIDDGLRAGLFTLDDLSGIAIVDEARLAVQDRLGELSPDEEVPEVVRHLINQMVRDLLDESRRRIADAAPQSVEEVRAAGRTLIGFSEAMQAHDKDLRGFLWPNMYRHRKVDAMTANARRIVRALFDHYSLHPTDMTDEWRDRFNLAREEEKPRAVCDFIAGMTDRFAIKEYERLGLK